MNKRTIRNGLGVVLALGFCVACGSSGVSSGVDKAKSGSEVTDEEAVKLCKAVADYSNSKAPSVDAVCNYAALQASALVYATGGDDAAIKSACETAASTCKEAETDGDNTADSSACESSTAPTACEATVGDVEQCATDIIDTLAEAVSSAPTCGEVSSEYFKNQGQSSSDSSSTACETVVKKCPALATLAGATSE